jgi:hypothetical protein
MSQKRTTPIDLGVLNGNYPAKFVTLDDVWEADRKMEEL